MSKFSMCLLMASFFVISFSSTNSLYGQTVKAKVVNKVTKLTPKQYKAIQNSNAKDLTSQLEKVYLKDGKAVLYKDKSENRILLLEQVGKTDVRYTFTDLKGNKLGGDMFTPPVLGATTCYICCCTPRECNAVPCDDIVIVND